MRTNGDDSAFNKTEYTTSGHAIKNGLTKREYFAAMVLPSVVPFMIGNDNIATEAVKLADALIKALNKEPEL